MKSIWVIAEQTFDDPASGMRLAFSVGEASAGCDCYLEITNKERTKSVVLVFEASGYLINSEVRPFLPDMIAAGEARMASASAADRIEHQQITDKHVEVHGKPAGSVGAEGENFNFKEVEKEVEKEVGHKVEEKGHSLDTERQDLDTIEDYRE
jgi:hypothetical protein